MLEKMDTSTLTKCPTCDSLLSPPDEAGLLVCPRCTWFDIILNQYPNHLTPISLIEENFDIIIKLSNSSEIRIPKKSKKFELQRLFWSSKVEDKVKLDDCEVFGFNLSTLNEGNVIDNERLWNIILDDSENGTLAQLNNLFLLNDLCHFLVAHINYYFDKNGKDLVAVNKNSSIRILAKKVYKKKQGLIFLFLFLSIPLLPLLFLLPGSTSCTDLETNIRKDIDSGKNIFTEKKLTDKVIAYSGC